MWHLDPPSEALCRTYSERVLEKLGKRVWDSPSLNIDEKTVLMPNGKDDYSTLKDLLLSKPQELFDLNNQLMPHFISEYNDDELDDYVKAKHTPNQYKSASQVQLINKYKPKLDILFEAFDYKHTISQNKSLSYLITKNIGGNTCVYCNRQYTFNIEKEGGRNDDNRFARPDLDHWFPESIYPLLSLSLYNLIPSCSVCNSSAKGDTIFRLSTHVHPYITTSYSPTWKFDYVDTGGNYEVRLDKLTDAKEVATAAAFFLKEAYQCHSELELKDLITIAKANSGSYIPTLLKAIIENVGSITKEEAYRILFGTEMAEDKYDDRPMSKFKRDILEKLGISL